MQQYSTWSYSVEIADGVLAQCWFGCWWLVQCCKMSATTSAFTPVVVSLGHQRHDRTRF
jgi:hypothetical protein